MKAIILSRVSSEGQDLIQQTNDMLYDAKCHGYDIDDIKIIEDKESAIKLSEEERNGLNELKDCILHNNIECVFVWEITRLSRQLQMLYSIRDFLQANKVQLYCHSPEFRLFNDDWSINDVSNIVFSLFAILAENEMKVKKERMRRGKNFAKSKGQYIGGSKLFGYDVDDNKRFVICEEESNLVKRIYKDYVTGFYSISLLADKYHDEGLFLGVGKKVVTNKINRILGNVNYVGNKVYPSIISKKLFDDVQVILKGNKRSCKFGVKHDLLLKGLMYDEYDKLLYGDFCRNVYKSDRYYDFKITTGLSVKIDIIDNFVFGIVKKINDSFVNKDRYIESLTNRIDLLFKNIGVRSYEILEEKKKYDVIEERFIDGRLSSIKRDKLIDDLDRKICLMDKDYEEVMKEFDRLSREKYDIENGKVFDVDYDKMSFVDKQELIRKYIKSIKIIRISRYSLSVSFVFNLDVNIDSSYVINSRK